MQGLFKAIGEASSVAVISGRSLDAVMASALLFDYLASSGLNASMSLQDYTISLEGHAELTIHVGTGYPSSGARDGHLFIDYAFKNGSPQGYISVSGSISRAVFRETGYGTKHAVEVGELDPFLKAPHALLPDDLFASDIYAIACPPLPGAINSKEELAEKSSSKELLVKAAEELLRRAGFSLELSFGVDRRVFAEANAITRELFKKQGDAAAMAFLVERGGVIRYEPDSLLLENLKQFFNHSDSWLIVNAKVGSLVLLPSSFPPTYYICPALPVVACFGDSKLPAFILEPVSDDRVFLWGLGNDFDFNEVVSMISKYGGSGLVSGRRVWAEFPHSAIEMANLLEE